VGLACTLRAAEVGVLKAAVAGGSHRSTRFQHCRRHLVLRIFWIGRHVVDTVLRMGRVKEKRCPRAWSVGQQRRCDIHAVILHAWFVCVAR
jgi:hypothetical protein